MEGEKGGGGGSSDARAGSVAYSPATAVSAPSSEGIVPFSGFLSTRLPQKV